MTRVAKPASYHRERRKREGSFRCEECLRVVPLSLERYQDGRYVCAELCERDMGVEDIRRFMADAEKGTDARIDFVERPVRSVFEGDPVVWTVGPSQLVIAPGDFAYFAIDGINLEHCTFTAASPLVVEEATGDLVILDDPGVVFKVTVPPFTGRVDYHLYMNGANAPLRRAIFQVR